MELYVKAGKGHKKCTRQIFKAIIQPYEHTSFFKVFVLGGAEFNISSIQ